jgi:hypothetical protein
MKKIYLYIYWPLEGGRKSLLYFSKPKKEIGMFGLSEVIPVEAMTVSQVAERIAQLRAHTHALSLHFDILTNEETSDHAWNLACAIDELDRELSADNSIVDSYVDNQNARV